MNEADQKYFDREGKSLRKRLAETRKTGDADAIANTEADLFEHNMEYAAARAADWDDQ